MVGPRMCVEHGRMAETHCGWCSRPVCDACIGEAHGHRLCGSCAAKLSKDKPLETRRQRDRGAIQNVDETLTDEHLARAREHLESMKKKKKDQPRIRNVPDWPVLRDD